MLNDMLGGTMWNPVVDSFDTRKDEFLIIDTGDLLIGLQERCKLRGEQSAVDFDDEMELDYFMEGLCSNLSVRSLHYATAGIETLLNNSDEYLAWKLTDYQRQLWRETGLELWGRFNHLGLYDAENTLMYEYKAMNGTAVILKRYDE